VAATTSPVTRRRLPTALPSWVARHKALVAFCLVVGAFYLWTVWSSGSPFLWHQDSSDYYNLLSDGFLGGHLHLLVDPSQQLLSLPNPYDPAANGPYKLHDLSLYHDKYYLYWGPTPALLLFIPFRVLGLGDMPQTLATFLFAFVGFCFALASLRLLARRFVPDAPRWMLAASAIALALGNALPFTLRRVAVYEVAITAGFCLSFIALYLVITGLQNGVRPWRLAWASLFVGLAVGARPTMAVWALALVVLAVILVRRETDRRARLKLAGVLVGPVAGVGILLMLYNVARFGSPLEFGQAYQLAGYDPNTKEGNKLKYVPPGVWYYLFSRPHLTLGFPFFHLGPPPFSYPFDPPPEYDGLEPTGGLLPMVPFVALAAAAPLVLRGVARRVALALIGVGLVIVFMVSFALWGATERYAVDFASTLLIVAALGWMAWAGRLSGVRRRALAIGGAALIGYGAIAGVAVSMTGYYNGLRGAYPKTWERLQSLTSPIPTALSYLDGEPKAVDVVGALLESNSDPNGGVGTVTFGLAAGAPAQLTVASGSPRRYGLQLSAEPQPPPPAGTSVKIVTPDTNRTLQIRPQFAPTVIPISLRRGLNRIVFSVEGPQSATTRLVGVHIVPLP
jgi:hypothetical protein